MKWFNSLSEGMKIAYIGAASLIVAGILSAVIAGVFQLVSKQPLWSISTPVAKAPSSTPIPTVLQTSSPTYIYLENGSDNWQGWNGTTDWKIFNGMLLNDGTNYCCGSEPTITAPYQVQGVANYAIEARIQVTNYPADYTPCFDITIRGTQIEDVWQGYKASIGCDGDIKIKVTKGTDAVLQHTAFSPEKVWHTYCLEARDSHILLFVDGNLTLQANDNRYLSGGQAGLKSFRTQLSVSSFKIINTCVV